MPSRTLALLLIEQPSVTNPGWQYLSARSVAGVDSAVLYDHPDQGDLLNQVAILCNPITRR
jgi:hypothetical protein